MHGPVGGIPLNEWTQARSVSACKDCGYHVCSCDRTVALEALREARYGSTWDSREIDDQHGYVSPEEARRLMGSLSGLNSVVRGAAVASQLRPCFVCSVPHNGGGAACLTCVQRADAETKPFRDAMDEKIKTLAKHAKHAYEKLGHLDLIWPLPEIQKVTIGHPPQDTCPCIDCRHARGQLPSRPVVLAPILGHDAATRDAVIKLLTTGECDSSPPDKFIE